jgi:hypothetical protein
VDSPGRLDRPPRLLTRNRRMREIGAWNWTLPAWAGRFADGRTYNTCPSAGICAQLCYARTGTYRFPAVLRRHEQNLQFVLDDLPGWEAAMTAELGSPRFHGAWVRIHDSGDFFSDAYTLAWLRIAAERPNTKFYAYTKEVERFRRLVTPRRLSNLKWVFSLGGTQDHTLDAGVDRVADVFPTEEAIAAAGWHSQRADDRLAVVGPAPVGMAANRIPHVLNRLNGHRFSELQTERDSAAAHRRSSRRREQR